MRQLISSRQYKDALELFDQQSASSTDATLVLALKASTKLSDQQRGIRIHQQLSASSLQNRFIQTSLIHFYMQCHHIDDALRIFSTVKTKTISMYGAMLKGYLSNNMPEKVIELYEEIPMEPDEVIITILFNACAKLCDARAVRLGKEVLDRLPPLFREHRQLLNAAIPMLMRFGDVQDAERLFKQVKNKTIVSYGAMMQNYIKNNRFAEALNFVEQVPFQLNEVLHILVFKTCALLCDERAKTLGKKTFEQMPKVFLTDVIVVNSAIHMFMRFGDIQSAERLFEQAKSKTIVSYGTMMQGYLTNNHVAKTLDFFEQIPLELDEVVHLIVYNACASLCDERAMHLGRNVVEQMPRRFWNHIPVINSAIHMYMNFGQVSDAEFLFKQIQQPTLHSYGVMINGYKINEQPQKSLALFEEMKKNDMKVNEPIALSLVGACAQLGMRSISERIVQQITHLRHDLQLQNSLIDMWGKSSHISRDEEIFQSISQPDFVTYNCMINTYGRNGMGHEAIDVYERMPENIRSPISHVCVLNACSHSGLIAQAQTIFDRINGKTDYIVTTMVDCLSRLGLFEEAQELIANYERSSPPSLIMYMALLSGARNHRHVALSEHLYDRMRRLFPDRRDNLIAASVLVSNTYSSSGDELKAKEVRLTRLKQLGKSIKVGVSWTEVNGEITKFQAHDRSHPRSDEIYAQVGRISEKLKEQGHQYDSAWITRPLKDGENIESVLCGHSEKLAIAFNLIQRPQPSFIQITKNLRVCGDCHRATKLIAKVYQCEIVVRDANRIHHFSPNGQCSCQDHF